MSKGYKRDDYLFRQAKEEGFRSRAAYKLKELNSKYNLIKPGNRVLDLGAWPGGWLQVAAEALGPNTGQSGVVIGIDLVDIEPLNLSQIQFIKGDATDPEIQRLLISVAKGKFNTILSDMSPKLTGIKEQDWARSYNCAETALHIAKETLVSGGALVIKLFKSPEAEQFVKSVKPLFNRIMRSELDASRNTSNEFYLIAIGFRGG